MTPTMTSIREDLVPVSPDLEALRRRYSDEALRSIPKLLQLVDRNPYSETYGCFDRSYWHYRTMDFPCGMSQEFCLPLALAFKYAFPDNPYFQKERVMQLALAGVDFARKSAHSDGSCDDYFPNERALGALVFSLYACTETCLQLDTRRDDLLEFFVRRASYLIEHNESGQLTNHQAFAALALHNVFELTGDSKFAAGRDEYMDVVASWQSGEGWFQEYEGADPGYHTCTISFLSKLYRKTEGTPTAERILTLLRPAIDFAWDFMHPDGSYGGEYGSRNTYHFYPYGFEVMAQFEEKAGQIADQFLNFALPRGSRYFNEDDRMCAHYVYDWMESARDFCLERDWAPLNERENFTRYYPQAQMIVKKTDRYHAAINLSKGGVIKMFNEDGPLLSDTGLIGRLADGRVLVTHLVGGKKYDVDADIDNRPQTASVRGYFAVRRRNLPTPFRQVLFRLINLTVGRVAPELMRSLLQKVLITGKTWTDVRFEREFTLTDEDIEIVDRIVHPTGLGSKRPDWVSLHLGSDATSIYVANSNVYQESVLLPWQDLSDLTSRINESERLEYRRNALGTKGTPAVTESDRARWERARERSRAQPEPEDIELELDMSDSGDE